MGMVVIKEVCVEMAQRKSHVRTKQPIATSEDGAHQDQNSPDIWPCSCSLQNCEQLKVCCRSHERYTALFGNPGRLKPTLNHTLNHTLNNPLSTPELRKHGLWSTACLSPESLLRTRNVTLPLRFAWISFFKVVPRRQLEWSKHCSAGSPGMFAWGTLMVFLKPCRTHWTW